MQFSNEAEKNKPRKPLNAYFQFRIDKLTELKDDHDKINKVKKLWNELNESQKQELQNKYYQELEEFKVKR